MSGNQNNTLPKPNVFTTNKVIDWEKVNTHFQSNSNDKTAEIDGILFLKIGETKLALVKSIPVGQKLEYILEVNFAISQENKLYSYKSSLK